LTRQSIKARAAGKKARCFLFVAPEDVRRSLAVEIVASRSVLRRGRFVDVAIGVGHAREFCARFAFPLPL
jgi:hypothetical protein